MYRSMIRKLQYVVHGRPNIALAIGLVARFFANPRENHLMVVKRIMRYLKGTDYFVLYYKRTEKFELNSYTNADWGGNVDDKKSTSGGALFLGRRLVTWAIKRKFVPHNPQLKLNMLMFPSTAPILYGLRNYERYEGRDNWTCDTLLW